MKKRLTPSELGLTEDDFDRVCREAAAEAFVRIAEVATTVGVGSLELKVLIYLAKIQNPLTRMAESSEADLSDATGIGERKVRRTMHWLADFGLLQATGESSRYYLAFLKISTLKSLDAVNCGVRPETMPERPSLGSHSVAEWVALCAQFDYRCVCCGGAGPLTRDHIVPQISDESSDLISNIQPLCGACNSKKGIRIIDYRMTPFTNTGERKTRP